MMTSIAPVAVCPFAGDREMAPDLGGAGGATETAVDDRSRAAIAAGADFPAGGGRSADDDLRVCYHESGHAVVGRAIGQQIGGATVDPRHGVEGLVWGPKYFEAKFSSDDRQSLIAQIERLMPEPGEDRADAADIFLHAFSRLVEVVAGTEAERLFCHREPWLASHDERDAIAYASLITSSSASTEALIASARVEAAALLTRWQHVVRHLTEELRVRRTMSGEEIDAAIARAVAEKALVDERRRRAAWRRVEEGAAWFTELSEQPVRSLGQSGHS